MSLTVAAGAGGGGAQVGTFAARPASAAKGTVYYVTDGPLAYVYDGAAWRPILPGGRLGMQPPTAGWTFDDADGKATLTTVGGTYAITTSGGGGQLAILRRPFVVASPSTVVLGFAVHGNMQGSFTTGFGWRDAAGKIMFRAFYADAGPPRNQQAIMSWWTNVSTFGANQYSAGHDASIYRGHVLYARLRDDGQYRQLHWSPTGFPPWTLEYSIARTTVLTADSYLVGVHTGQNECSVHLLSVEESSP